MYERDAEDEKEVAAAEQIVSELPAQQPGPTGPTLPDAGRRVPAFAPEQNPPGGEQVPRRPPGALQRLRDRLERGGGLRGARLAELALRAGITLPPREAEMHGAGSLEAALWMDLVRENATLRHEAEKLTERQETLSRRIQRAKARLQVLRLEVFQRRTGLTAKDLVPSSPTWQSLIRRRPKRTPAQTDPRMPGGEAKSAEASREQAPGGKNDEATKATEPD